MVRKVTDGLIDAFEPHHADLVTQFAYPQPLAIILHMLGVPEDAHEACRAWTQDLMALHFVPDLPQPVRESALRGSAAFQEFAVDLVTERAARPQDDLISHVLTTSVHGFEPLSVMEVVSLIPGMILAGHEATACTLSNLMWSLLTRPALLEEIRRDPEQVADLVEEGLRHDSTVLGFARTATCDTQIADTAIPAGAQVLTLLGSANHDERRFPDPQEFNLDRVNRQRHLTFGWGIHYCLGAPLARLELRVAVQQLLHRLPGLRPADPHFVPQLHPSFIARGWTSLPVTWDTT